MTFLFWDSSAIAKRYATEAGTPEVNQLFGASSSSLVAMGVVSLVFAETFSLLVRKRNRGDIDLPTFRTAFSALRREVVQNPSFIVLPVEDGAVYSAIAIIERHNINTSDAMMLVQYLHYLGGQPDAKGVLVASDARLLRAAAQEGLATLDPERISPAELTAFLASL